MYESHAQVKAMMRSADEDNSGTIDFPEFVAAVASDRNFIKIVDKLRERFSGNSGGDISMEQFVNDCLSAPITQLVDAECEALIRAGDCYPDFRTCNRSECEATFVLMLFNLDLLSALVTKITEMQCEDLQKKITAAGLNIGINQDAVQRDAFKMFINACHRFSHPNGCTDIDKMHSYRKSLCINAVYVSLEEVRDESNRRLHAERTRTTSSGFNNAAQNVGNCSQQ